MPAAFDALPACSWVMSGESPSQAILSGFSIAQTRRATTGNSTNSAKVITADGDSKH
jgi:hypothetical protein